VQLLQLEQAKACGFFYLLNHGIGADDFATILRIAREFFALPLATKEASSDPVNHRGYEAFYVDNLGGDVSKDYKEGFYAARHCDPGHELAGTPLHGPNVWPGEPKEMQDVMEGYRSTLEDVGRRVCTLLGMDCGTFPMTFLKLLHYPVTTPGQITCGGHSDYGLLTFLLVESAGLEVDVGGTWQQVAMPPKGGLICNFGDYCEKMGQVKSTQHRVVSLGKERYSAALFFEGDPRSKFGGDETCLEYLLGRYAATKA